MSRCFELYIFPDESDYQAVLNSGYYIANDIDLDKMREFYADVVGDESITLVLNHIHNMIFTGNIEIRNSAGKDITDELGVRQLINREWPPLFADIEQRIAAWGFVVVGFDSHNQPFAHNIQHDAKRFGILTDVRTRTHVYFAIFGQSHSYRMAASAPPRGGSGGEGGGGSSEGTRRGMKRKRQQQKTTATLEEMTADIRRRYVDGSTFGSGPGGGGGAGLLGANSPGGAATLAAYYTGAYVFEVRRPFPHGMPNSIIVPLSGSIQFASFLKQFFAIGTAKSTMQSFILSSAKSENNDITQPARLDVGTMGAHSVVANEQIAEQDIDRIVRSEDIFKQRELLKSDRLQASRFTRDALDSTKFGSSSSYQLPTELLDQLGVPILLPQGVEFAAIVPSIVPMNADQIVSFLQYTGRAISAVFGIPIATLTGESGGGGSAGHATNYNQMAMHNQAIESRADVISSIGEVFAHVLVSTVNPTLYAREILDRYERGDSVDAPIHDGARESAALLDSIHKRGVDAAEPMFYLSRILPVPFILHMWNNGFMTHEQCTERLAIATSQPRESFATQHIDPTSGEPVMKAALLRQWISTFGAEPAASGSGGASSSSSGGGSKGAATAAPPKLPPDATSVSNSQGGSTETQLKKYMRMLTNSDANSM